MDRNPITMINRRRMLADTLNACTAQEIRQEVSAALHRKFPAKGHAVHCAAEILEATQEYGQPPREIEANLYFHPNVNGKLWSAFMWGLCAAFAALIVWGGYHAAKNSMDGAREYQG